jgi:hypothetical protein
MGPPSKEPVEAVVDPRAAPRQSLLEVTYAKLDAKGVGARGVNDLPSRVVLLCENDSRLESAETSGSFWPAVFAAARTEQTGNKTPFAYTGATAVYPDSTLVAIESTGGGILAALRALEKILGRAKTDDGDGAAGEKAPFASARVVASSEDAASAFPGWHAGFVEALALDDGYEPLEEARVLKSRDEGQRRGRRARDAARSRRARRGRRGGGGGARRDARAGVGRCVPDAAAAHGGVAERGRTARRRSRSSWTCMTPRWTWTWTRRTCGRRRRRCGSDEGFSTVASRDAIAMSRKKWLYII